MTEEIKRAVAVVGPTASGKTAFAIGLAERFFGEIVGCDSMQIYRGLDIGTAKPTAQERARVPHHLIDFLSPAQSYSAADYAVAAEETVAALSARGVLPVFCGGTGLYLEAARSGRHEGLPPVDKTVRKALEEEARQYGSEEMHRRLAICDAQSAATIHPNNIRRVLRALEIYRATGRPKSEWDAESRTRAPKLAMLILGLIPSEREVLHRRIDRRVDEMVAAGLRGEVERLLAAGLLPEGSCARAAIGYKEYIEAIEGRITEEEAICNIKIATHRYARRQLTWFRATEGLIPLAVGEDGIEEAELERAYRLTESFIRQE